MEKITELEQDMILRIAENDYQYDTPVVPSDTNVWTNVIVSTPQDKGVFSSLIKKALVEHTAYYSEGNPDNTIQLTKAGFEYYLAHKTVCSS